MNNTDPLETTAVNKTQQSLYKRGRPRVSEVIRFSPQTKSAIILEFLKNSKHKQSEDNSKSPILSNTHSNAVTDTLKDIDDDVCKVYDQRSKDKQECSKYIETYKKDKQFACDYPGCRYSAKLSCNLIKHKRIHTSEKPFICDQCTFRTNFINSLKVHKRTHSAENPYSCEYCAYRCNSSSNLKKHCRHRHQKC